MTVGSAAAGIRLAPHTTRPTAATSRHRTRFLNIGLPLLVEIRCELTLDVRGATRIPRAVKRPDLELRWDVAGSAGSSRLAMGRRPGLGLAFVGGTAVSAETIRRPPELAPAGPRQQQPAAKSHAEAPRGRPHGAFEVVQGHEAEEQHKREHPH